jgi:hydroxyethylthiazole kinase-like uncharacterized protein yjeF
MRLSFPRPSLPRTAFGSRLGAVAACAVAATAMAASAAASSLAGAGAGSRSASLPFFLSARDAAALDAELMPNPADQHLQPGAEDGPGFTLDQLMELAGLSVATALARVYPVSTHRRVLVLAGPGNNGGDGLVCARHLSLWGYDVTVSAPKHPSRAGSDTARVYAALVRQLASHGVPVLERVPSSPEEAAAHFDIAVDAVFGFSFAGEVRPPFDHALKVLAGVSERGPREAAVVVASGDAEAFPGPAASSLGGSVKRLRGIPVVSVDVPSGWDVDKGPGAGANGASGQLRPSMLVSLTAPKPCAAHFDGPHHWLGGRFVPAEVARKWGLADALEEAWSGAAPGEQAVELK